MSTNPYDLSEAVYYHMGAFPPRILDYEVLIATES
ncbi:hypothetical protein BV95_04423 [Sphingobium chlorophenolicum]|uniref:Uncharacterized protein n=1 Tax=Sphingobium chlorophenolicum TaxID=46429 RepID=A0A081R7Y3_SPHCR|nr:hypothetical protein BV95_04423 [Sphingobium chlorophenolicum]